MNIEEIEKIKLNNQIEMYKNNISIVKQNQLWAILNNNNNPEPSNYSSKYNYNNISLNDNILQEEFNISETIHNNINNEKYFSDNTLKIIILFIIILLLILLIFSL